MPQPVRMLCFKCFWFPIVLLFIWSYAFSFALIRCLETATASVCSNHLFIQNKRIAPVGGKLVVLLGTKLSVTNVKSNPQPFVRFVIILVGLSWAKGAQYYLINLTLFTNLDANPFFDDIINGGIRKTMLTLYRMWPIFQILVWPWSQHNGYLTTICDADRQELKSESQKKRRNVFLGIGRKCHIVTEKTKFLDFVSVILVCKAWFSNLINWSVSSPQVIKATFLSFLKILTVILVNVIRYPACNPTRVKQGITGYSVLKSLDMEQPQLAIFARIGMNIFRFQKLVDWKTVLFRYLYSSGEQLATEVFNIDEVHQLNGKVYGHPMRVLLSLILLNHFNHRTNWNGLHYHHLHR